MPTVTIDNRRFPSNTTIGPSSMYALVDGSANTFAADQYITVPDPSDPSLFQTYVFLFWNILSDVHTANSVPVSDVGHSDFNASAWYLLTGPGGGTPNVSTAAFSVGANQVLGDTPIASVSPGSAWAGGNATSVDTTQAAVTIDAKDTIGSEAFDSWMIFGGGSASGDDLSVPKNGSAIAVASFKQGAAATPSLPGIDVWRVIDIFDRIRGKMGDWVTDPAPIDLARVLSRASEAQGLDAAEDELNRLTERVGELDRAELEKAKTMLDLRASRLRTAQRMVDSALRRGK